MQPLWETVLRFPPEIKQRTAKRPSNPTPGDSAENKTKQKTPKQNH